MELMTWEEVQQELKNVEDKNLLLGNGFSISYKADDFNQKSIIKEIDFLAESTDVYDIEECIAKTQELVSEGSTYTVPKETINYWIKTAIHKAFIERLFAKMPPTVRAKNDYNEKTLVPYKDFLSKFNKYYTLNYDPLLYWMSLHFINNGDKDVQAVMNAEEKYNNAKDGSKSKENSKIKFYEQVTNCMSKIREKIFVYKAQKDKYNMKVYFADKCLYDETLSKAEADKTIAIDKISNTLCQSMGKICNEDEEIKEEFEANGKYLLTSAKGLYLIHPDKNIELKKTISGLADDIKSKQLKFVAEQVKNGKSGFITMSKSSVFNKEVVFVYSPIPKTNWSSYLVYSSDNFYKPVKHFQLIFLSVIVFGVFLLILFINWICKFTTNPVVKLSQVAEKYGKGEFEAELPPVTSNDEVGILTQAFYNMRDNLLNLLKIQKENAKEEQKRTSELEIATKIQSSVLPVDFPKTTHFNMYASMHPAKEVGGDFYDFFFIDENRFVFLIADVSGKGIPAALFMMNSKSLLKSNLLSGYPLNVAINKTNNELCATNEAGMFLTAFIAILNTATGELEYVNAGHNPPAVKLNDKFEYLKSDSNLVLSAMENYEYKSAKIFLKPENNILIYTDGVTEAQNSKEELYGEERLINLLNNKVQEPKEMIETIKADINEFANGTFQTDDITILDIKYLG